MASIIKYSLKELKELISDDKSCVHVKTVIQNIALQPWGLANVTQSVSNVLDSKIGKYERELAGIMISYKNVKILNNLGTIRNDSAEIYIDVQVDLYVFRPEVGTILRGVINNKSVTHLGVLVHRLFNVVIPKPSDLAWVGSRLTVGQTVLFEIMMVDLFGALPYIRGCLDESSLPPLDDDDIYNNSDEERRKVTHVNFDGIKPQMHYNTVGSPPSSSKLKVESDSESTTHSRVSKAKLNKNSEKSQSVPSPTTMIQEEINKNKNKLPDDDSHSDSISDVEEHIMINRASVIKKIMERERIIASMEKANTLNKSGSTRVNNSETPSCNHLDVKPKKLDFKSSTLKMSPGKPKLDIKKLSKDQFDGGSSIVNIKLQKHSESDASGSSDGDEERDTKNSKNNDSVSENIKTVTNSLCKNIVKKLSKSKDTKSDESKSFDSKEEKDVKEHEKSIPNNDSSRKNARKVAINSITQGKGNLKARSKLSESSDNSESDSEGESNVKRIIKSTGTINTPSIKNKRLTNLSNQMKTKSSDSEGENNVKRIIKTTPKDSPSGKIKPLANSSSQNEIKKVSKSKDSDISKNSDSEEESGSKINMSTQSDIQKTNKQNSKQNVQLTPDLNTKKLTPNVKTDLVKVNSPENVRSKKSMSNTGKSALTNSEGKPDKNKNTPKISEKDNKSPGIKKKSNNTPSLDVKKTGVELSNMKNDKIFSVGSNETNVSIRNDSSISSKNVKSVNNSLSQNKIKKVSKSEDSDISESSDSEEESGSKINSSTQSDIQKISNARKSFINNSVNSFSPTGDKINSPRDTLNNSKQNTKLTPDFSTKKLMPNVKSDLLKVNSPDNVGSKKSMSSTRESILTNSKEKPDKNKNTPKISEKDNKSPRKKNKLNNTQFLDVNKTGVELSNIKNDKIFSVGSNETNVSIRNDSSISDFQANKPSFISKTDDEFMSDSNKPNKKKKKQKYALSLNKDINVKSEKFKPSPDFLGKKIRPANNVKELTSNIEEVKDKILLKSHKKKEILDNVGFISNINPNNKKDTPSPTKKNKDPTRNIQDDKYCKNTPDLSKKKNSRTPNLELKTKSQNNSSLSSIDIAYSPSTVKNWEHINANESKYDVSSNTFYGTAMEVDLNKPKSKRKSKHSLGDADYSEEISNTKKRKRSQEGTDDFDSYEASSSSKKSKKNKKIKIDCSVDTPSKNKQSMSDDGDREDKNELSDSQYLAYLHSNTDLKKQIQLLIRKSLSKQ